MTQLPTGNSQRGAHSQIDKVSKLDGAGTVATFIRLGSIMLCMLKVVAMCTRWQAWELVLYRDWRRLVLLQGMSWKLILILSRAADWAVTPQRATAASRLEMPELDLRNRDLLPPRNMGRMGALVL